MNLRAVILLTTVMTMAGASGAVFAHHSISGLFDVSKSVTLQGSVAGVEWVNPHSFIYLDVKGADGRVERWALEGPSAFHVERRGLNKDTFVRVGDELGVCGYVSWNAVRHNSTEQTAGRPGRLLSAAVLLLQNAEPRIWSNYRHGKCELDH